MSTHPLDVKVKALAFDVFGTVVDWRGSIIREGAAFGAGRGIDVDWSRFADAWRAGYRPAMQKVRSGELPWLKIDALAPAHPRRAAWPSTACAGSTKSDIDHLNRVWHRLDPWPDAVPGLTRLKTSLRHHHAVERQFFAPHQHGEARRIALGLHRLGGAVSTTTSPTRRLISALRNCWALRRPSSCWWRAILTICARRGPRAAAPVTSARPLEMGLGQPPLRVEDGEFDVVAGDFVELAERLGA